MTDRVHDYRLALHWDSPGQGTVDYRSYSRQFRVEMSGKPDLLGSADPHFRGDAQLYNPEELLVIALSSCHMLSYLALCALKRVRVLAYIDEAHGRMVEHGNGGRFEEVTLRPRVTIAADSDLALARSLHHDAHESCYIASSVNFPVVCEPQLTVR
jgi:organic hydroperoxide reductase OsmC/OhrA